MRITSLRGRFGTQEAPTQIYDVAVGVCLKEGRGRSAVERLTLVQDYPEGGQRCQDIELFVRSLYIRQVSRLVAPSTHRGVDLVMAWVHRAYGHLRQGRRILISACDFLQLPEAMPLYWRIALQALPLHAYHKFTRSLHSKAPYDLEQSARSLGSNDPSTSGAACSAWMRLATAESA